MKQTVITQGYERYASFIESLDTQFYERGETIYKARNEIKVFTLPDGAVLNVKRFAVPNIINRYVYATLRKPKALRAYENAFTLMERGIATPQPVAYVLHRTSLSIAHSYLITLQSPLRRNMYEFGDTDLDGRDEIVKAFARFTAHLHKQGVYHKDYSPGNILFDQTPEGDYTFCLVDINRMVFGNVTIDMGCRSFCRLWGREAFMRLLSAEYADAMRADPEMVREKVFKYHRAFWKNRYNHF